MRIVNTSENIKSAALKLFCEQGFSKTSIAAIEKAAGLAPRAGAFYRHFKSKETLLEELAREHITETPNDFDFEGLQLLNDTRAELITIARQYEKAIEKQMPFIKLIEEIRLLEFGAEFELQANNEMLDALMHWTAGKQRAKNLKKEKLAALTLNIFGSWLFYLTKSQQGIRFNHLNKNVVIRDWAEFWSDWLDAKLP